MTHAAQWVCRRYHCGWNYALVISFRFDAESKHPDGACWTAVQQNTQGKVRLCGLHKVFPLTPWDDGLTSPPTPHRLGSYIPAQLTCTVNSGADDEHLRGTFFFLNLVQLSSFGLFVNLHAPTLFWFASLTPKFLHCRTTKDTSIFILFQMLWRTEANLLLHNCSTLSSHSSKPRHQTSMQLLQRNEAKPGIKTGEKLWKSEKKNITLQQCTTLCQLHNKTQ